MVFEEIMGIDPKNIFHGSGKVFYIKEVDCKDIEELNRIGKFRYDLWDKETIIDKSLFPGGVWLEELDFSVKHWIAVEKETNEIVAVARLSIHDTLQETPDGSLWVEKDYNLSGPIGYICKLGCSSSVRGLGIGKRMNEIRMDAARILGANSMIVTASPSNSSILFKLGWKDTGIRVTFPNRPTTEFWGLEYIINEK